MVVVLLLLLYVRDLLLRVKRNSPLSPTGKTFKQWMEENTNKANNMKLPNGLLNTLINKKNM